jgi:hypothetical protein
MMTYVILNSLLRVTLTALLAFKLIYFGDMLNRIERLGMGMMGGASFLTVALIIDVHKEGTPFDGWATTLLTLGAIIYFGGRLSRHRRHRRANAIAIEDARRHFERRPR